MHLHVHIIILLKEESNGEEREKRDSLPSVKRPCGEMENANSTKRPRIHQQTENQQVSS